MCVCVYKKYYSDLKASLQCPKKKKKAQFLNNALICIYERNPQSYFGGLKELFYLAFQIYLKEIKGTHSILCPSLTEKKNLYLVVNIT